MSAERPPCEQPAADDDLVVRAKTDPGSFGELYDRYYPQVARYCLRRLFDRTVAEDVVSEMFLQVTRHIRQFPGTTEIDFRRWLFRMATNAVNAHLRQSRRRQELWDAAARSRHWERSGSSHPSSAEHEVLDWPIVYQAILEFDERDQSIVMLRFFADFQCDEIAAVIDATPGAVRTALSRALSRLREKFNPVPVPASSLPQTERGL
ncbi:MAG: sigma-70 family RNA polymerase sigma factor [Planctomycetes bacterium]|nr:sigma-70 family RNA polymerase sigma factor [Planctomycetota bacterium]